VQVWDTDSGLPNSTVTSIAQTPDGYIWVGTRYGGLARFDGSRFVTFNPVNTPELKSIEIRKLLVDAGGTLWIGTVEGGSISYRDGKFKTEYENPQTPASWMNEIISQRNGEILLSSQYGWLFRGQRVAGTNRWTTFVPPHMNGGPSIAEDRDGVVWYRTDNSRLAQLRGTNLLRLENPAGLRSPRVNALGKDASGLIYVGTEKEIAVWDGKKFLDLTPTNGEPNVAVRQMVSGAAGAFWVLTENKLRKCVNG
jgi:ligand-binding sensor domain-containing protein